MVRFLSVEFYYQLPRNRKKTDNMNETVFNFLGIQGIIKEAIIKIFDIKN